MCNCRETDILFVKFIFKLGQLSKIQKSSKRVSNKVVKHNSGNFERYNIFEQQLQLEPDIQDLLDQIKLLKQENEY